MNRFTPRHRNDKGLSLIETLVCVFLVTVVSLAVLGTEVTRVSTVTRSERMSVAQGQSAAVVAKIRQSDFNDLGFYSDDQGVMPQVNLPLGSTQDARDTLREDTVILGSVRPSFSSTFTAKPVMVFSDGKQDYKVSVHVTKVTPTDGSSANHAKRITVVTEWGPKGQGDALSGTCEASINSCSVQSVVRYPSGSDVDPDGNSASSSSACLVVQNAICETYVRSGRVLDGSMLASNFDNVFQSDAVTFESRTTQPATAMRATWQYTVRSANGAVSTRSESVQLTSTNGGTLWKGEVPADGLDADPRGIIRPGTVDVRFAATFDSAPATATKDTQAFWSYQMNTNGAGDRLTATLSDESRGATTWCQASGTPTALTFSTSGHSAGFDIGTDVPTSSRDNIAVLFTVREGGKIVTKSVTPTLISRDDITETVNGSNFIVGASAQWSVVPPTTSTCSVSRTAVVSITRASDKSTVTIPLTLSVTGA